MQAVNSFTPSSPKPGIDLSNLPTSNKFEPAKNAEVASNVVTVEALLGNKAMPESLASIRSYLTYANLYSLVDTSTYMEGMSKWQR